MGRPLIGANDQRVGFYNEQFASSCTYYLFNLIKLTSRGDANMLYLHARDGTSSFTTMGKKWASCFLIATCTLTCAKHLQSATTAAISGTDQTLAFSATLICPQGFCKSITPIPPFLIILSPNPQQFFLTAAVSKQSYFRKASRTC